MNSILTLSLIINLILILSFSMDITPVINKQILLMWRDMVIRLG